MKVTLGGDRLGSGNKQTQEMKKFHRSTFNQEQDWKSTMAPGILYPSLCIPMTNGDSMDIDMDALIKTLPTKGPLFGSFKYQTDIFTVPMRLYNGILHNNPLNIGLKMNQIYMPKLKLQYDNNAPKVAGSNDYNWQVNETGLLKYLGFSGIGTITTDNGRGLRLINAIPILAYYDIFKNYYANKQEDNAYVIGPGRATAEAVEITAFSVWNAIGTKIGSYIDNQTAPLYDGENSLSKILNVQITVPKKYEKEVISGEILNFVQFMIEDADINEEPLDWNVIDGCYNDPTDYTLAELKDNLFTIVISEDEDLNFLITVTINPSIYQTGYRMHVAVKGLATGYESADIELKPFELQNIDDMRKALLSHNEIGEQFVIGRDWDDQSGSDESGLPYSTLFSITDDGINFNSFKQNGLVVKTYQSDIFQNWLDTEWIEGENGIAAISAVNVSEGTLEMDALNLAQKVYNMLNRIALSGGTYEDWQEAVYTEDAVRKAESPIYEGGMSGEILFEPVTSTSETKIDGSPAALGTLGGKGQLVHETKKGGRNIHIRAKEPVFVMAITSITPRICYTQGNEWYLTELNSYDDLHKPSLDGIGFQDLICEQIGWWDTKVKDAGEIQRRSAGKIVAWSNYMTAVDKAYGEFAQPQGKGFMVLSRNYERMGSDIADMTTYIDPAKFNYAFAFTNLDAQNFWAEIHYFIKTRRVMSAHQIPNL